MEPAGGSREVPRVAVRWSLLSWRCRFPQARCFGDLLACGASLVQAKVHKPAVGPTSAVDLSQTVPAHCVAAVQASWRLVQRVVGWRAYLQRAGPCGGPSCRMVRLRREVARCPSFHGANFRARRNSRWLRFRNGYARSSRLLELFDGEGTHAFHLERVSKFVARGRKMEASFLAAPTAILVSIWSALIRAGQLLQGNVTGDGCVVASAACAFDPKGVVLCTARWPSDCTAERRFSCYFEPRTLSPSVRLDPKTMRRLIVRRPEIHVN